MCVWESAVLLLFFFQFSDELIDNTLGHLGLLLLVQIIEFFDFTILDLLRLKELGTESGRVFVFASEDFDEGWRVEVLLE